MTEPDEQDQPLEPLTPATEAALRRTLAGAAGPEPVPDDVAARLDRALEGLVAERKASVSHPENPGIVVPLDAAARRRRVRVRALLAAAAAVIAAGVGAGVINGTGSQGEDMTAADSDDAPARDTASLADGVEGGADAKSELDQEQAPSADDAATPAPEFGSTPLRRVVSDEPLREVREDHLREDLVALQHVALPHEGTADYERATLSAPADFMCEPGDFGAGYLVGVTYDGQPAVVGFREPRGSNQEADVLACGTGDVLHSVTLAATD